MTTWLIDHYYTLKALHVIAIIAWMAGMLYLPRLFVYHVAAVKGGELSETLKIMERRLLRAIINPAMIASFLFGGLMLWARPEFLTGGQGFMHAKLFLVVVLTGIHGWLSRLRKQFERDENRHTALFYRVLNEVPTVLMIGIVFLVILQPF